MSRPPRLAKALLDRSLPADVRAGITGDLDERLSRDAALDGARAARWRYRRAALAIATRFLIERLREAAAGSLAWRVSFLDLRLGLRMLVRYPVLTLIGTASLSLGIALGAAVFAFISLILWPILPLPDGDRVVSVRLYDTAGNQYESRLTADLRRWQQAATSLIELGAGRGFNRNLTMADGVIEPVNVAEVTASTFPMARVAPVAGRALTDADAAPSAPPVMVIGERLWRSRFGADPAILGRQITLADTPTAVVGIMPEGFRFPRAHEVWVPLRLDATAAPRTGTPLRVWARLQDGVTLPQAATEFDVLAAAAATAWPATHEHLRAVVMPFAASSSALAPADRLAIGSINLGVALLVLLISGNVALLMFARAATRESEILVRTALGASRGRLIRQFFAESLVLSALAAIVGLALARMAVGWGVEAFAAAESTNQLPFWLTPRLPPLSIAYGCGLALLAAIVTGVLPAFKMTRGLSSRLRESSAGGGGVTFGGIWTTLIVAQIAVTVTFPVVAFYVKRDAWQIEATDIGIPPAEVLSASLARDVDLSQARYLAAVLAVRDRLAAAPGIRRVALADKLPFTWHGHYIIDVDEGGAAALEEGGMWDAPVDGYRVSTAAVDPAFFSTFDAEPLAGRLFTDADYAGPARVAVVNQSFVARVLGGRNPIGRRLHYRKELDPNGGQRPPIGTPPPSIEIVGLVRDLGMATEPDPKVAGIYLPLDLRSLGTVQIAARVSGDITAATAALQQIAARTDPLLRVSAVQPLDQVTVGALREINFWARLAGAVGLSALVLALSGIYAVTSFAVARRTREIGIRVALGSSRGRLIASILRRPLLQLSCGIVAGWVLILLLSGQISFRPGLVAGLTVYVVLMGVVCLCACVVPARRAMAVDPIEALRME
jgi:putative ABC transport system permease protein